MSIVTYSGTEFNYLNPTAEMINVDDILLSLPRLNRFVGHSSRAYSVGEHTFFCLMMAEKLGFTVREQLLTFIHDFTEAYVGDCPAPLKQLLPRFEEIEANVEIAICKHLGIEPPTKEEHMKVKRIDLTMLVLEMRDMTVHSWENFINEFTHIEMLNDSDFNLKNKTFNESDMRTALSLMFKTLMRQYKEEYFMEAETKEYEIYVGIGDSDDDINFIEKVELESDLEARKYAELCAFGVYNMNPTRDIFEIMEQDNVDEEEALEIFKEEAMDSVVFFALGYEIDEDGNKRMIRHY